MASFFSKVLGRKKGEHSKERKRTSAPSLLEGKFEAVSPNVSPSAAHFPANQDFRGRENAKAKGFFRVKSRSRARSPPVKERGSLEVSPPHLSLNLSAPKDQGQRSLGVLFEADPDGWATLSDAVLGERRLTPQESLALVNACSRVIVERGLETLGIMHAHWYSASLDVQRKLISLYILSLTPPVSQSTSEAFETELGYARSPHDVAAVLRWGLRHLKLEGDSFGKEGSEWAWYDAFAQAERSDSYPSKAYTNTLIPSLPSAHSELLGATLDIISSLASHSEANGFSGSKLSKYLGLWLLSAERASEGDDWGAFYGRWEKAGRILEHIFLARIRDEASSQKVPRRLTELVDRYPYTTNASPEDDGLLARPRFSTRAYDALFVRLETEYTGTSKPKPHPFNVLANAFSSSSDASEDELLQVWNAIKQASRGESEGDDPASTDSASLPVLSNVFSDTALRLLSLIPVDGTDKLSPTFALHSAVSSAANHHRSFSPSELSPRTPTRNGHGTGNGHGSNSGHGRLPSLSAGATSPTTAASVENPTDWLQFTSQGFPANVPDPREFASTLWDTDLEVTKPPVVLSRKSSKLSRSRRSSVDATVPALATPVPPAPAVPVTKTALIARTKLDEAFIDFWTDALLDPIAASWPKFVVCELKPLPSLPTPFAYLVVEQAYVRPPPPPAPPAPEPEPVAERTPPRRPMSPESRLSSTFSITKKRFGFFTSKEGSPTGTASGKEEKGKKRASKTPAVDEMGEILKEEEEKPEVEGGAEGKAAAAAGAAVVGGAVAGGAVAETVAEDKQDEAKSAEDAPTAPAEEPAPAPASEDKTSAPAAESADAPKDEPSSVPVPETVVPVPVPVPADSTGDVLPPAPEQTVLAGSTPGPQVALATSEPVAVAQASVDVVEPVSVEVGTPGVEVEESAPAPEPGPDLTEAAPASEPVEVAVEVKPVEEPAPAVEETPVSAPEEPMVEPKVEEVVTPVVKESASAPIAEGVVSAVVEESAPAPVVEEVTPAPTAEEPVATAAENSAPAPAVEEPVVPTDEKPAAPAVQESAPAPIVEEPAPPAAEEPAPAPAVKEPSPARALEAEPVIEDPTSVASENTAPAVAVEEVTHAPGDDTPTLVKEALDLADAPIIELTAPVDAEEKPAVEDVQPIEEPVAHEPVVEESVAEPEPATVAPPIEEPTSVLTAEGALVAEPALAEVPPPVTEETPSASVGGAVEEPSAPEPVVEESAAPESVVEDPTAPESMMEDPAAPEPVVEGSTAAEAAVEKPATESTTTSEPVLEEAPSPTAPQSVVEEATVPPAPDPVTETTLPESVPEKLPAPKPIVEKSETEPVAEVVAAPEPTAPVAAQPVSEETAPGSTEEPSTSAEPSTEEVAPAEPVVEPAPAAPSDNHATPEASSEPSTSVLIAADGHAIVVPEIPEVLPEEGVVFEEPYVEQHIPLDEEEADDAAFAAGGNDATPWPVTDEDADEPAQPEDNEPQPTVLSDNTPVEISE